MQSTKMLSSTNSTHVKTIAASANVSILGRSSFEYERLCDNCIDLNNFGQCAHALLTYCFLVTLFSQNT